MRNEEWSKLHKGAIYGLRLLPNRRRPTFGAMKHRYLLPLVALAPVVAPAQTIHSPTRQLTLQVQVSPSGEPMYQVRRGAATVLLPSRLGLTLAATDRADLATDLRVVQTDSSAHDDTWTPVWGETRTIRNRYQELALTLATGTWPARRFIIRFQVYDDGIGFRYEFPKQDGLNYFQIATERTEFNLPSDPVAWWLPGDYDTNEYQYTTSKLSAARAEIAIPAPEIGLKVAPASAAPVVQTPLLLKTPTGLYISLHEAAQVDFPAMQLAIQPGSSLRAHLVPSAVTGSAAFLQTPAVTPWRTLIASNKATDLLASKLILNLNEPSKITGDVSWIKPQKFVGVWWEMHVNRASWNYADGGNLKLADTDFSQLKPNGRHGANTTNVKKYIDFAAKHGFPSVLVEGWNVGWEDWYGNWKEEVFDFVTPYPDFNVKELQQYAAAKGVHLIMHHETSGSITNYERRLPAALDFMQANGYLAAKTGYVGRIIPRGEHHDGQWMSNHFARVAEAMAQRRLLVDMHESVRPTGLHRTWPNWLASEAARGNEFNAWSQGNTPAHETILPFTRLMGGPMDYTPGIFQLKLDFWNPTANKGRAVHTTLAKQLALYLTMYSPLQMAADLPEAYEAHLDAFQFIKDVPVDWADSRYLAAEPGAYVVVARQDKASTDWYLGAITNEEGRTQTVKLDFLPAGQTFEAVTYADAPDAHWDTNPAAYRISKQKVTNKSTLKLVLAPGGGAAIRFVAIKK
jgi:glucan 1,4-alpha-glucosidase